ncbi:protein kinase domain-containing protein [Peristeroidobacter agariperforans]|uniref:protein kinase domain-containing protein n=1 Tax=Peristeroidobacter agariperforans TaxID=268404 RepID=UPI00101D7912|nr:protein kinase [Peristeroidobacter agariperforans]
MSLSIDKDLGEQGENARAVLASWLDDYISGRCDRADMQAQFLSVCRSNPDAPWDALALLDQYQRRGRIDVALARTLKTDIAQLVFGVANQTESKADGAPGDHDTTDVTIDTTGSRWRKLMAERDPDSINSEPAFVDPSLLRRGDEDATAFRREIEEPPTRPPPSLKHTDDDSILVRGRPQEPAPGVHTHGPAIERERERPMRPSSVPPPGLTSDVLRDRYELTSILGRGSTGTVYKAIDRHRAHLEPSSRCVAVKVLKLNYQDRPDELAQLEREFHEAQSLSHPNVVSVFDLDRDGNVYFIVMELLEGELLADILKRLDGQPMARHYALGVISSVGAALAHAHRRNVVHADLKPRNVMITTTGEVRVLDFGFARDRPLDLHTASGLHEGPGVAPAYASVERVNGSDPHPSDDVYSLACIAYELLSGRHPFGGRSAPLARAHGRAPQRIPGLTGKQQQALQRALMWTRGERRIDIVELLAGLGCGEAPSRLGSPSELITPDSSLGRWRRAAVAVTLALVIASGAYAVWQYGLLPNNLANVLPVMPPIADRERQSEVAANTGVVEEDTAARDTIGSQPMAPIAPPDVEPLPSGQRQTAPSVPGPAQSGQQSAQTTVPTRPRGEAQVPVPLPELTRPSAASRQSAEREAGQSGQQTSRAQSQEAEPSASGSSASVASSSAPAGATRPVIVEFDKDSYVTSEGDGSVRLVIRRTGSTRRAVAVSWTLRSNSAEMGADFAGIGPGVERIPAGAREANITIPLVQDSIKETTELFLVELQVNEEGVTLGERSSAAVIIVDDD